VSRRLEPATLVLILICLCFTASWRLFHIYDHPAGALRLDLLWEGQVWRMVTAMFQHGGWTHVILNSISLYFVGTVVARGLGRPVFLTVLFFGAEAGFAASIFGTRGVGYRVGISGGIAALLGLILAVEWRYAKSVGAFFKARNTLLILFFVGLSVALGLYIEKSQPGVVVDHAAHAGGGLFGLVAGLAYYGKRKRRRLHGAAAVVLLGILPAAYVCHPFFDPTFYLFRAERAYQAGRVEEAGGDYERLLRLDVGNPLAGARLAQIRNAPRYLEGLREPRYAEEHEALLAALLSLARARLKEQPQKALEFVRRAMPLRPAPSKVWAELAAQASGAGRGEISLLGYEMALKLAQAERVPLSISVRYAYPLLAHYSVLLGAGSARTDTLTRLKLARRAVQVALIASAGVVVDQANARHHRAIIGQVDQVLVLVSGIARAAASKSGEELRSLQAALAQAYRRLAALTDEELPEASTRFLFRAASWGWLAVEGTAGAKTERETILAQARRAFAEAREHGDKRTQRLVRQWFEKHGLPAPTGELAPAGSGG